MRRGLAIFAALTVGWVVYMIAMMMTVYDGFLSMIFQPIIAVVCSSFTVAIALFVGLLFRIPFLGRWWRRTPLTAVFLMVTSLALMCFGSSMGLKQTFTHPETKEVTEGLRPDAALGGYFVLLFAIANWPVRPKPNSYQGGAGNWPPPL